jgi:ferric-dicitrate binding protein FerR (iron transport regulator)
MLDEHLRRRLAEVASEDPSALGAEATSRILRRVATEGPGLVRSGRRARRLVMASGPILAAAAVVALLVGRHARSSAVAAGALPVARSTSACAARPVPGSARRGFVSGPGGARLELGSVAVAAAAPGAVVRLREASACRTALELEAGTVTVHARDLGGGELRVHAPGGEVTVHGTIFAVSQSADSFTVEVAEGRVSVVDRLGTHIVSGGGRLLVSAVGVAEGALSEARAHAMRAAVDAPEIVGLDTLQPFAQDDPAVQGQQPAGQPRAVGAAPGAAGPGAGPGAQAVDLGPGGGPAAEEVRGLSSSDPLAVAEEARRAGDFARAREFYRRAGDASGVTAEAACVALARMELALGHGGAAREATKRRQQRFGQGTLAPEALWIDVRTYRQTGDLARARELARELVRRWPTSPQARAARQWLSGE